MVVCCCVHTAYSFSQYSDETKYACSLARAFTALTHKQNGYIHGIFYHSMLRQTLACVQPRQSLHCSHTCTKWAYIQYIISVNAQTRLSLRTVSSEPLLLAHWQNGCRQTIRLKSVHVYRSNLYIYNKYQNCMRWLK